MQLLAGRAGLDAYLRSRGHVHVPVSDRERAEATLRAFLERLFENATEFVLSEERLSRATSELDALLTASRADVEVVVPLLGVSLASDEVALADGLALIRPQTLDNVPDEAAWDGEHPNALVYVTGGDEGVAADAPTRARRVVTALRLYDAARVAMGPAAWIRTAGGAVAGRGNRAPAAALTACSSSGSTPRMSCARSATWSGGGFRDAASSRGRCDATSSAASARRPSALTDHLLALRALLEPEGPASGLLADRVAALCADGRAVRAVAERIAARGRARARDHRRPGGGDGAVALVDELAGHLRAILRDVLCGHLDSDLRSVADALLTTA